MTEREPQFQDFRITSKEYELYKGDLDLPGWLWLTGALAVYLTAFVGAFIIGNESLVRAFLLAFGFLILPGFILVPALVFIVGPLLSQVKRTRLMRSPVASQIEFYEEAMAAYRKAEDEIDRKRQQAEWARWEAEMEAEMTDDVLKFILEKAEEGIPRHTINWYIGQLGPLTDELLYCEQKGFVGLFFTEFTIQSYIGLTEAGKAELARLRSL